ncbi:MAG: hypothetical protein H0V88_02110 [Pyrinomonadaceae bacterium]|nr:hypothetical protein [Pyrinomonadaceae bacterium]
MRPPLSFIHHHRRLDRCAGIYIRARTASPSHRAQESSSYTIPNFIAYQSNKRHYASLKICQNFPLAFLSNKQSRDL